MMYDRRPESASPDLYLKSGKTMLLSVIKLAEAVLAFYFAYVIFAEATVKSEFLTLLSNQGYAGPSTETGLVYKFIYRIMTSEDMSWDALSKAYDTLKTIYKILVGSMFALVGLEGLAFFSSVWAKRGTGVVKAIRAVRIVAAVLALIWAVYDIGDLIVNISKAANSSNTGFFKVIEMGYDSVFKFFILIATYLAAPIVLIIYHSNVIKMMDAAGPELHIGRINGGIYHKMEKIAGFVAVIFAAATFVTFIRVVGNGTECADFISYIGVETVSILFAGVKWTSLLIVGVMLVKYVLVCLCSLDFDRIHRQHSR